MNYFELYPGDYLRDTTRLTLVEHGAYLRLLMAYYAEEEPLPADHGELYVIVSAVSAADKAAVRKVSDRFFPVGSDGLRRNGRADEEIAKAQKRMATSRENGGKGGRPKKPRENPPGNPAGNPAGFENGGFSEPSRNPSETCSGEALQTPDPRPQAKALTPASTQGDPRPPAAPTEAGRACLLMREAGCISASPSYQPLLAALAAGVTPEALGDTAAEGVATGKTNPFKWACATALARLNDGTSQTNGASHGTAQPRESLVDRNARRAAEILGGSGPE